MQKSFERMTIRRVFALAFFFSIFLFFWGRPLSAQTYVTNNGIIMERLPEEDLQEVERLNEEAEDEDELERLLLSEQNELDDSAENDLESEDSIDDLFGEGSEGDVAEAVTTPTTEIVKVDAKNKPVEFSGSLSAELGGYLYFYPWEKTKPLATFSNTLRFIGRPRNDFYVYGSFRTAFPQMDFGIYELYFDYTLFGVADISAGKRDIGWGHSRILDTNIIDDKLSIITDEEATRKRERTTNDSKFTFSTVVPIMSYGSVQALAQYETNVMEEEMQQFVSLAGRAEFNVEKFSFGILGKRWASADTQKLKPCLGVEVVSSILGKDSNLFFQALSHFSGYSFSNFASNFARIRWTTGIYKYFEAPIMLGLAFEYQGIWGDEELKNDSGAIGQYKGVQHLFGGEISWSHFIFRKKWTFGCKWFHDTKGENNAGFYGTLTPGIQISEVLPHLDFKIAAPISYGSKERYGLVFEVILNLNY